MEAFEDWMKRVTVRGRIRPKIFYLTYSGGVDPSAVSFAADELLDAAVSFVVGHLDGRMLGEISGG